MLPDYIEMSALLFFVRGDEEKVLALDFAGPSYKDCMDQAKEFIDIMVEKGWKLTTSSILPKYPKHYRKR